MVQIRVSVLLATLLYGITSLAQTFDELTLRLLLKQQSSSFPPMLTPFGWVEHPEVIAIRRMLYELSLPQNDNNAQSVREQVRQNASNVMVKEPIPTKESMNEAENKRLHGKPPELNRQERVIKDLVETLKEADQRSTAMKESDYYHSPTYLNDLPNYISAKDFIKEMLEGKRPLSIKDAYFKAEFAFGNLLLSYDEYNKLIQSNANFIRQWLTEKNYALNDPEALHYGIQKFLSDTLYIHVNGKPVGHMPYYYDYIDVSASEDRRNYFVTKTLATGTGQCHTFPVTYLILAEALGVQATIAYNPKHSFIRYKNNRGMVMNYETTVDRFLGDAFYLQTLPVMATAQKNKLYIYGLSKKQAIASVLHDMAANFIHEHWVSDGDFIRECITIAKPCFADKGYISNTECYLQKRLYAEELNKKALEKGIKDAIEFEKYPDVMQAYTNYYRYVEQMNQLGVQNFPASEELRMMEFYDKKKRLQTAKKINAKEKRSLFIN